MTSNATGLVLVFVGIPILVGLVARAVARVRGASVGMALAAAGGCAALMFAMLLVGAYGTMLWALGNVQK